MGCGDGVGFGCGCWWGWVWLCGVLILKKLASLGVIRVCDMGISSSCLGSCCSHLENQLDGSSLICSDQIKKLIQGFLWVCCWECIKLLE
ncbi:hypothetical protein Hanom_Chr06g00499291 [Helianthus anomalus]